jgi:hypothetical protein
MHLGISRHIEFHLSFEFLRIYGIYVIYRQLIALPADAASDKQ